MPDNKAREKLLDLLDKKAFNPGRRKTCPYGFP
jgi:hypothetical protein